MSAGVILHVISSSANLYHTNILPYKYTSYLYNQIETEHMGKIFCVSFIVRETCNSHFVVEVVFQHKETQVLLSINREFPASIQL